MVDTHTGSRFCAPWEGDHGIAGSEAFKIVQPCGAELVQDLSGDVELREVAAERRAKTLPVATRCERNEEETERRGQDRDADEPNSFSA